MVNLNEIHKFRGSIFMTVTARKGSQTNQTHKIIFNFVGKSKIDKLK